MNIHKEALQVIGREEALQKLRKEAIELAHAIDQLEEGKGSVEHVVHEFRDVCFVWERIQFIREFENELFRSGRPHFIKSTVKLQTVIDKKVSDKAMQDYVGDAD